MFRSVRSMRMQISSQNRSDVLTVNMDGRDNNAGDTFRFQNFVVMTTYTPTTYSSSASESYNGRVCIARYGCVDVTTTNPFIYTVSTQENPDSGGPVVLSGAGNSRAAITPLTTSFVKIEVDAEGDSLYESRHAYVWSNLAGEPVVPAPIADAGPDQSVATGAGVKLNGSGSVDLLDKPLTYSWFLYTRPPGSTAVLSDPTATVTTFFPDQPGTYTINLSASNGTTNGTVTVVITATGPANSGLFKSYEAYPTGSWPEAVAIGDVNGDGRNDVVLVTSFYFDAEHDYKLFVFLQDASGALAAPPAIYATTGSSAHCPTSVAIGDINNDGKNEVVVGNSGQDIEVFAQDGSGGLVSSAVYSTINSHKIKIADLNHDGRLDVVGIGWGTDTADVLLQNAGGTLNPSITYTVTHGGYDDLEVGDVNNDGLTDIIVMSGQSLLPNVGLLTQKTDGTFNPPVYYSVGSNILTSGIGVGDVNGDSLNDIVVTYDKTGVFTQNNSGALNPVVPDTPIYVDQPVEIADMNNDGRKSSHYWSGRVYSERKWNAPA